MVPQWLLGGYLSIIRCVPTAPEKLGKKLVGHYSVFLNVLSNKLVSLIAISYRKIFSAIPHTYGTDFKRLYVHKWKAHKICNQILFTNLQITPFHCFKHESLSTTADSLKPSEILNWVKWTEFQKQLSSFLVNSKAATKMALHWHRLDTPLILCSTKKVLTTICYKRLKHIFKTMAWKLWKKNHGKPLRRPLAVR